MVAIPVLAIVAMAVMAGWLLQRAADMPEPLEEAEEHQTGTNKLFVVFLVVAAVALVVLL